MKVYKVVIKQEGNLVSAWARDEWKETYVPDEWTYPLHGKTGLFAFRGEQAALEWASCPIASQSWEVWEAEAESTEPVPSRIPSVRTASAQCILEWWKQLRMGDSPSLEGTPSQSWYVPAVWCSGIRLTKQLHVRF